MNTEQKMQQEERRIFIRKNLRELTTSTVIEPEFVVALLSLNLIEDSESNLLLDGKTPNVTKAIKLYSQTMNKWDHSQFESFKKILKETGNTVAVNILAAQNVHNEPIKTMRVVIQDSEGLQYDIAGITAGENVNALKEKICSITGISPAEQTLVYVGRKLVDDTYLSKYCILDGSMINMLQTAVGSGSKGASTGKLFSLISISNFPGSIKVKIEDLQGRQYDLTLTEAEQNVNKLKQEIHSLTGISPADQTLMYKGQVLVDSSNLLEYDIQNVAGGGRSAASETPFIPASSTKPPITIRVIIQDLDGRQHDVSETVAEYSVNNLKQKIYGIAGISPANQRLIYSKKELQDDDILSERIISDDWLIMMARRPAECRKRRASTETVRNPKSRCTSPVSMKVTIQELDGEEYDVILTEAEQNVNTLKQKFYWYTGIIPAKQKLFYGGVKLEDGFDLVKKYGIVDGCKIKRTPLSFGGGSFRPRSKRADIVLFVDD